MEKAVCLAIVGSRTFQDQALFDRTMDEFVDQYGWPSRVVSGGARGADTMGAKWARKHNIPLTELRPEWKDENGVFDRGAGIKRNTDIVRECTHMVAFPSRKGRGTQDSIRKAEKKGVFLMVKWSE